MISAANETDHASLIQSRERIYYQSWDEIKRSAIHILEESTTLLIDIAAFKKATYYWLAGWESSWTISSILAFALVASLSPPPMMLLFSNRSCVLWSASQLCILLFPCIYNERVELAYCIATPTVGPEYTQLKKGSHIAGSNHGPSHYEWDALTTEPIRQMLWLAPLFLGN